MEDQRDYAEENYNRNLCPECDESPCCGGMGKGSCMCEGHESLRGDSMGVTVYCNGACAR